MDIFEYLPQLIVAYDGNDEFANLIHVKKANKDNNYFCPCCGGNVKPRALDSTNEQSHYYHVTGKCTKESQLHFFCKNWLFDEGSKFYVNDSLFEVESIEIEKPYETPFGKYIPDVTVHTTTGIDIYFEMFFTNRKTGDDYFCKWDYIGNDVVEVNIKEYMFKTDADTIPTFTYLYHDGNCYSKPYIKRDLYANTIARIKHELTRQKVLNYKARIEQLDWFWQEIRNNKSREEILNVIDNMEYDDMVSCYEIIKRKQCVSYLKNDVLDLINQKVVSEVRYSLELPHDENIYFDLEHVKGRTYKAGIRLNIKTEHITYNKLISTHKCWMSFDNIKGFPKIVFSKNIFNKNEINLTKSNFDEIQDIYKKTIHVKENILEYEDKLTKFEENSQYKVRMNNDLYTIIKENGECKNETILEKCNIPDLDIDALNTRIKNKVKEEKDKKLINDILENTECKSLIQGLNGYKGLDCYVDLKYEKKAYVVLHIGGSSDFFTLDEISVDRFNQIISECKNKLEELSKTYEIISNIVNQVNSCKNNIWNATISFSYDDITVDIDQKVFNPKYSYDATGERIYFYYDTKYSKNRIKKYFTGAMNSVLNNMEDCGYRVMEVHNEK